MKQIRFLDTAAGPVPWLRDDAPEAEVAVSSRLRIARNLAGTPFPGQLGTDGRVQLLQRLADRIAGLPLWSAPSVASMADLESIERHILLERRLATPELVNSGQGSAVVFDDEKQWSVLVNEEDHLRIQGIRAGLDLETLWGRAVEFDGMLGQILDFAFHEKLGYLTACPSNVGSGLRASVMLHLPALVLLERQEAVLRAVQALGLTARGAFGEGSEPVGSYFQISNQSTLGEVEETIIARLEAVVRRIVWAERNARKELLTQDPTRVYDFVGRAYGILRYAARLSSQEAFAQLSAVRLGVHLGILHSIPARTVDDLLVRIQPAHLQILARKTLGTDARDAFRAELVRNTLLAS